jgi:hypothetical protein
MNFQLLLLALCQGFFMTNNVTFIAVNGLVGLSLAPVQSGGTSAHGAASAVFSSA